MRSVYVVSVLASIALTAFSTQTLLAQNAAAALKGGILGISAAACADEDARKPSIEPYTAVRKTTQVQKLANGVTITHETTGKEARDSSGRTYRETQSDVPIGGDAPVQSQVFFIVFDPVNRVSISWSSNSKEAIANHMADPKQVRLNSPPPPPLQTQAAPGFGVAGGVFGSAGTAGPAVRPVRLVREDLGTKTINGVEAKGTRTKQTYPPGKVGNDQPFTVTHETWMSLELRVPVLQIDDDPRTGTRTTELAKIQIGEPDPALFQPPEGYTVKDRYPGQQN